MQRMWINIDGRTEELAVPLSTDEVISGVEWGALEHLFTPAFWKCQAEIQIKQNRYRTHRLGETLLEEVAVCLLGGYGIPAELGLVAFGRLKSRCLLDGSATEDELREQLSIPFEIEGRLRRYRFHSQKASYLARSLTEVRNITAHQGDRITRDLLLQLPGIGPKTASWIVRNHYDSDEVAIIDVHLHRAGVMMKLFDATSSPLRDYFTLERAFLDFAKAIAIRASVLDAVIWDFMRRVGPTARVRRATGGTNQQLALAF